MSSLGLTIYAICALITFIAIMHDGIREGKISGERLLWCIPACLIPFVNFATAFISMIYFIDWFSKKTIWSRK